MITYVYDDLFYSPARVLVNPVNTYGTMGTGFAYDFKRFFPEMYESYRQICQEDRLADGQLMLYKTPHKWIVNFPTKRHHRAAATLEHIDMSLQKFTSIYAEAGITSASFPKLGSDEDELDWNAVRTRMEAYLKPLPLMVYIHLGRPDDDRLPDQNENRSARAMRSWLNTPPRTISFDEFWGDLVRVGRSQTSWETINSAQPFKAVVIEPKGRQRRSVKLTPRRGDSFFLPETQLRDLWQYVQRAGYVLPQNLPAGLDEQAEYLITFLATLPYLRLVYLAPSTGDVAVGLHYIPPPGKDEMMRQVELVFR